MGMPLADGRIELNPKVHHIMQAFAAKPLKGQVDDPNSIALTTLPQSLAGINFDIQPLPVEAPKTSIGEKISRGPVERIDFRE